ncbi:MAG: MBL fold metallo-hydrolase [Actinobacteria bacterium]|nr:MBL fold metallo-hydrolase [Actinomycetota bacterium]
MSADPILTFLGGAGTVTGSKFLVDVAGQRVLIDCGLFQGLRELRARNWSPLPGVAPAELAAVVITHAHLDHCGYLPRLVRGGFSGPVYVTADTAALMAVVLPDSGRLLEEESDFANDKGYSRHSPALPLYTEADAIDSLGLLQSIDFGATFAPANQMSCRFDVAGHILGSATLRCEMEAPSTGTSLVVRFSGDLGRGSHPLLKPPQPPGDADWIVVESTYGDREHDVDDPVDRLADLITRTVERDGMVIVPSFAVDRTDVLLFHLARLAREGRLPKVPVFVDSPMALAALSVYRRSMVEGRADVRAELRGDDDVFAVPGIEEVHDADGSRAISARSHSAIVIAGAGMATGGRVVHHLERFLPDRKNSVALVGFQANGTRGRSLLDGADSLKIHGHYVKVRAEIVDLTGFSVHADRSELLDWIGAADREPLGTFVVHGEQAASLSLATGIRERDLSAATPVHGERVRLLGRR